MTDGWIFVLCEACGSEGHEYSGHLNDPHPRYVGPCRYCDGKGAEAVPTYPVTAEDMAEIDAAIPTSQ